LGVEVESASGGVEGNSGTPYARGRRWGHGVEFEKRKKLCCGGGVIR
jgi:hypothetical protein